MLRLLLLTYPLTPVEEAACGGTEQVAFHLLRNLASEPDDLALTWIGAAGSSGPVSCLKWEQVLADYGLAAPRPDLYTPDRLNDLQQRCNQAVVRFAADHGFDLIHNLGAWAPEVAGQVRTPMLFSVHLARSLYPATLFDSLPRTLHVHCVSQSQHSEYGPVACCGVVANGIDLQRFTPRPQPAESGAPLLYLGRICPEKGCHLAIAIARRARRPLWLVGDVAPFPSHRVYFEREIAPHLDASIRWMPAPPAPGKHELLRAAAAVVLPSLINETSSLLAMEAAACGVPALALRTGALPELVVHGETGYIASRWEDLAGAAHPDRLNAILPSTCRARAEQLFCSRRMAADYRALYRRLTAAPSEH